MRDNLDGDKKECLEKEDTKTKQEKRDNLDDNGREQIKKRTRKEKKKSVIT